MFTYLKRLWTDELVAARLVRTVAMAVGVYLATPKGRSEWERAIPAVLTALGVGIPSAKKDNGS
jgi:hypothetical protein